MNLQLNYKSESTARIASRSNWGHFLFSGVILLGSMGIYQALQGEAMRREIAQDRRDNTVLRTNLSKSDHALQQALAGFHNELDQLHAELASAHAEAGESMAIAQAAAVHHADALVGKLEKKRRQQEEQQRQLSAELNRVKESTDETSTMLNGISSDVGRVQSEVESVRSVARMASANLQEVRGDLGIMSGLLATNADEIQALRDLGDSDVYEFTLAKSALMQRVGDIQLALDKADSKRNLFTVEILAADEKVEKRDKTVNEPLQFYVPGKGSHPYVLVVNEIGKNTVKGYLAMPRVIAARNDAGTPN